MRAFRAWPRWKPAAPAEAWIHRIAINVSISHRRQQRLHEIGEVIRRFGTPQPGVDPADSTEATALHKALQRLPAKQAATLVLRHHHGYSNREIGYALNISESTVASRLAAAKRHLAALLRIEDLIWILRRVRALSLCTHVHSESSSDGPYRPHAPTEPR